MQGESHDATASTLHSAELFNALMHVKRWCRQEMQEHINPPAPLGNAKLLQSEQDVTDMMKAYSELIFERVFRSNDVHDTSTTNRQAEIENANLLKERFGLADSIKTNSLVDHSLNLIRRSLASWVTADSFREVEERKTADWIALHMWLERRLATGFRLLYVDGSQWPADQASSHLFRVVLDWPHTFTRAIFGDFPVSDQQPCSSGPESLSSFCTALCAFDNQAEKELFETTSKLGERDYIYLWCGDSPGTPSDFREGDLVWFRQPVSFHYGSQVQERPDLAIGPEDRCDRLWALIRDKLAIGQRIREDYHEEPYLPLRLAYTEELNRVADVAIAASSRDDLHWLARNSETVKRLLGKEWTQRDCFWMIQSTMFYDWKYWYLFPSRFEGNPLGGLAISTRSPIESNNLLQIALITRELLGVFGEVEDWARRRLQRRRVRNLWNATKRVHKAWDGLGAKGKFDRESKEEQETLFRNILRVIFQPHASRERDQKEEWGTAADHYIEWPEAFGITKDDWMAWYEQNRPLPMPNEKMQTTWNERQRNNIAYAVINYWNEARQKEGERGFAEWLKPSLNSQKALWDRLYNRYRAMTAGARNMEIPLFTFNDFLFDRAPRKAILGWRGYNDQIVNRGKESPAAWISEPPFLTHGVERVLLVRKPDQLGLEEFQKSQMMDPKGEAFVTGYLKDYVEELKAQVDSLKPCLQILLEDYEQRLEDFIEKSPQPVSFDLYEGDVEYLRKDVLPALKSQAEALVDRSSDEDFSARYQVAEYLIRTAIYLNTRMHIGNEDFLGFMRCAFLARTLIEHYVPTLYFREDNQPYAGRDLWHFYSIPIHIPLPRTRTQKVQRTSILSLCTFDPLHDSELRVWRELGGQIVVPAIMIDLQNESRKMGEELGAADMREKQLPIVVHSMRNKVKKPRTLVDEVYMNSAFEPEKRSCWPLGEALKSALDNSGVRDLPSLVSDLFTSTREAEKQIHLIDRIAKQRWDLRRPLRRDQNRIFLDPGEARVSFASTMIEQLQRAIKDIPQSSLLNQDYKLTGVMESALNELRISSSMTDEHIEAALKQCLPHHGFSIDLEAAKGVYVEANHDNEELTLIQCWQQFCEDWASNLIIHGPKVDDLVRTIGIGSRRRTDSLDIHIHSSISRAIDADRMRYIGLGTTTMEWCAFCISGLKHYSNSLDKDKREWITRISIPVS
jgi:hypothetical protein